MQLSSASGLKEITHHQSKVCEMCYKDNHEHTDTADMQHYLKVNSSKHNNDVKLFDYTWHI